MAWYSGLRVPLRPILQGAGVLTRCRGIRSRRPASSRATTRGPPVVFARGAAGRAIGRTPGWGGKGGAGSRFADGDTHPTPGFPDSRTPICHLLGLKREECSRVEGGGMSHDAVAHTLP